MHVVQGRGKTWVWGLGGDEGEAAKSASVDKSKDIRLGAKHIGAVVDEWYVRVDQMKKEASSRSCTIM